VDPKWILKGLVESVFVVASILLALAVDEWAQNKEYEELADQTLVIFQREIVQNRARLVDVSPYHGGIRDLLGQMSAIEEENLDVRPFFEGLDPPVLLNTAWETALATGALTHMDFEIVSALSLTYSIQEGFQERVGDRRPSFAPPEILSAPQRRQQVSEAHAYVMDLTRGETELIAVYDEALTLIAQALGRAGAEGDDPHLTGTAGRARESEGHR
jgi:hypothetical protein